MDSREQFEKWWATRDSNLTDWDKAMALMGWQASREALVVELPDGWFDDRYGEYLATHTQIEQALSAAGIKWK